MRTHSLLLVLIGTLVQGAFGTEYSVAIDPQFPRTESQNLLNAFVRAIEQSQPGDRWLWVDGGNLREIAGFNVTGTPQQRFNRAETTRGLTALREFLLTRLRPGDHTGLPFQALASLELLAQSGNRSGSNRVILVLGNPLMTPRSNDEAAFAMNGGAFPGRGLIAADSTANPYGCKGRTELGGAPVYWCVFDEDWPESAMHRHAVQNVWSETVNQLGGHLALFSPDPELTIERAIQQKPSLLPAARGFEYPSPDQNMYHLQDDQTCVAVDAERLTLRRVSSRLKTTNTVDLYNRTNSPARMKQNLDSIATSLPKLGQSSTRIAIVWEAEACSDSADIDLWISPFPGSKEINFARKSVRGARLHKDIRHGSNSKSQGFAWEAADIYHTQLNDITVWLNAFSVCGPVHGILRLEHGNRHRDIPFHFDINRGDFADGRFFRSNVPQWQRIGLQPPAATASSRQQSSKSSTDKSVLH